MFRTKASTTTPKRSVNKLVTGFVAIATTAVVGTAGIAGAAPAGKPTKAQCEAAGYRNYGQCVKEWATNRPGNGYGGNTTVTNNNNISVTLSNVYNSTVNFVVNVFN